MNGGSDGGAALGPEGHAGSPGSGDPLLLWASAREARQLRRMPDARNVPALVNSLERPSQIVDPLQIVLPGPFDVLSVPLPKTFWQQLLPTKVPPVMVSVQPSAHSTQRPCTDLKKPPSTVTSGMRDFWSLPYREP